MAQVLNRGPDRLRPQASAQTRYRVGTNVPRTGSGACRSVRGVAV